MSEITTQTLRFHRQQTYPVLSDLEESIRAVLRMHTTRLAARKVEVVLETRPTPRVPLLEGDMRQVLNNLVRNAYEAMPNGGYLRVRLRPAVSPSTGKEGVHLTVADTGTGFLPKMRAHLYEPFHTSKEVTGTGLGLWISKGIVEKHGGTIAMRSLTETTPDEAHGTVFLLWLPLVAAPVTAELPA